MYGITVIVCIRNCGKVYHTDCVTVGKDDSSFGSGNSWVCGKPLSLLIISYFIVLANCMQKITCNHNVSV